MDRSFVDLNRASSLRMRRMAETLTDEQLLTPVGPDWTVAIVLAHLAFWDRRVMYVLDRSEQDGKLFIPEIATYVNDIFLPFWAAIPPKQAAWLGVENAELLDRRLEAYPPALLDEIYAFNPRWVNRSLHRGDHLAAADEALKGQ